MEPVATHLQFGPFTLLESVGTGGMGEVFKAVHLEQQVPVAIKVMMARRAQDPRFREAFRQEVRSVARLDHPGIIMVFDCGEVSPRLERQSDGRMVAGSAWLAMELASHGLEDVDKTGLDWWHIKNIMMRILDALAHSHARGVIHRDLKPGNVLFVPGPDGVQLKLSDFGLAHALDDVRHDHDDDLGTKVSGTPRFMAPEQITGKWREQGSWTDLYSLGCMAYWLASGEPPFHSGETREILQGHLSEELPPLQPSMAIPEGFSKWLERLLAKDPLARYRRAADAAHGLLALGDPPGPRGPRRPLTMATMNLVPGGGTLGDELREDMGLTEIISDVLTLPEPPRQHRSPQPTPIHRVRLMPQTWRRKEAPRRTMEMVGVGIELFGLRQVPFVDRVEERDAIWNALWGVHQARKPRGILLTGLGGTGKTRLAEWITERAHEVGAASILTAHHSPISGPADGVGRMIANYLRCVGQSREHILTRVRALIGEDGPLDADDLHACMALTELIAPAADPHYDESSARVRFNNPKERHLVFQRFLARLATRRPILLLFDDIQWGNESLEYIQSLFEPLVSEKLPVLVLMTLGQEALAARPLAKRQVTAIWNERNVDTITVEPLKPDDHRQLIEHLLGLEADLVDKVVQRTAGNPLFAVQLIGDWIERGMLGLGRDGFYLKPGEEAWLPDDIHHVIRDRIAQLVKQDLDGPAQSALIALELAAALGHDVERREWEYACRLNGIPVPLLVLDAMVTSRLAQVNRQGWAFTQGVFRESLERLAIEAGRWPEHHRICAEMLIQLYSAHHPGIGQRIAHHFIEAGAWNEALEPLLLAARQNWVRCDFEPARALYNLYEDALEKLNLPPVDKRRIHGWTERASMLMRQNEIEEALALLDTAEAPARTQRWRLELGQILITRAKLFMQRGQISEGIILAQEAMAIFDEVEDPLGQIRSTYCLADLYYWGGNLTQALKYYIRALEGFIKLDEPYEAATVKMSLGALYTKLDRAEEGIASLEEAIEVFETVGDSNALANCLNSLGELNRFAGRLAQAEVYYQKALTTLERIGINDDTIVCFNLGLTLLAQEKYADADVIFKDVLRSLLASTRKGYIGLAHVGNLPGSAVNRDWKRWDHHLSEARRHLMESGMVDTDGARIAELAGKIAIEAGEDERGQLALALARKQFETLSGS